MHRPRHRNFSHIYWQRGRAIAGEFPTKLPDPRQYPESQPAHLAARGGRRGLLKLSGRLSSGAWCRQLVEIVKVGANTFENFFFAITKCCRMSIKNWANLCPKRTHALCPWRVTASECGIVAPGSVRLKGLERRRLNPKHRARKIAALSELYGIEAAGLLPRSFPTRLVS